MLQIEKKDRDAIVSFLETIVVPAQTGANIMQVVALMRGLQDIPEITETK